MGLSGPLILLYEQEKNGATHEPDARHVRHFCKASYYNSLVVYFPGFRTVVECGVWSRGCLHFPQRGIRHTGPRHLGGATVEITLDLKMTAKVMSWGLHPIMQKTKHDHRSKVECRRRIPFKKFIRSSRPCPENSLNIVPN